MKKLLTLIAQAMLVSGLVTSVTACHNPLAGGDGGNVKPPEPPIKDISYYQSLIKEQEQYIVDCDQMLQEIKDNKDGYDDEADYQSALDEVSAEQFSYKSLINEYQYQILLLEKEHDKFTPDQVLQGIIIFTEKSFNLAQELKLKEKYPDYYSLQELQIIKNNIKAGKEILKIFEDLRKEQE